MEISLFVICCVIGALNLTAVVFLARKMEAMSEVLYDMMISDVKVYRQIIADEEDMKSVELH